MHIDSARELKASLCRQAADCLGPETARATFLGVSVLGPGRYGVAVRYHDPAAAALAKRAMDLAGPEVDAREVGVVHHLAALPQMGAGEWDPGQLRQRARPLRPGVSIGHKDATAGTLAGFVRLANADGLFALSNSHVLTNGGRGRDGDPVLQPGPLDGGTTGDEVARLSRALRPARRARNQVDAAVALLSPSVTGAVSLDYPSGRLRGTAAVDHDVEVEKVGRTTGLTRGRVTAIELDDVDVEYWDGPATFDDQLEVGGPTGPFSLGGDSGALVYRPDTMEAVGLLFAGSERGGVDGSPLAYCTPIAVVLDRLGATLET
ncbi:MAG: hypothetical protein ACLGIA_13895 [Actinomycetes bacterium]